MEYRIGLEKQNKRNDQVTELILDNCRASQISGLTEEFVNLEMLSLINVGLTTLKGFPKLPKLRKLELSDNRLTGGLNLLHGSPKLLHLNLGGNRIKDFEALEPLKEFHELVSLDLYHCEITKTEDYRKKVFELLPNLKALDGFDKYDAEVADSDEDDEEGSDVDNHISRDDNDLEEDDDVQEVDDGQEDGDDDDDVDDEDSFSSSEGSQMNDEEIDDAEGDFDEEGDDDDDDDDLDDEDDDADDEEEDIEQNTSSVISASANTTVNNECRTHENLDDDDDVEEVDGDDDNDDEDLGDEWEDDVSDLKLLQKDSIVDDDDDADFEPNQEPDERDHEIDPEDDADEENDANASGRLSASTLDNTVKDVESTGTRGQKRKLEDEGGDEGNEAEAE